MYDIETLINSYTLTIDEYLLLPEDEKLEYCNMHFGHLVNGQIGEVQMGRGYIHEMYQKYFLLSGCTVENYDFGKEKYEITKEYESVFVSNKEALSKLRAHIIAIVCTRLKLHKKDIEHKDGKIPKVISKRKEFIIDEDLNDAKKFILAEIQLRPLLDNADGNQVNLDKLVNPYYEEVLTDMGYTVTRDKPVTKVYI